MVATQAVVPELPAANKEDTQKDKYLTFSLANESYGIAIRCVTEIICIQKITEVPDLPDFLRGVINLRDKVIPVMDVRTRFGLEYRPYDDRTCIIVVNISGRAMGLVVDRMNEVADIPEHHIEPPPRSRHEQGGYLQGMGKIDNNVIILLDIDFLLADEELEALVEENKG